MSLIMLVIFLGILAFGVAFMLATLDALDVIDRIDEDKRVYTSRVAVWLRHTRKPGKAR